MARARAAEEDRVFLDEHLGRGSLPEPDRTRALEILRASGAIGDAERSVGSLIDGAAAGLDPAVIGAERADALRSIAEALRPPA